MQQLRTVTGRELLELIVLYKMHGLVNNFNVNNIQLNK